MKIYKVLFALILFVISFFSFNIIEFDLLNQAISKYLQPFIFSSTLVISIFVSNFRVKLFYLALFFIFLAVITYLLNQLMLSNSLSSIGIGVLFITLLSYLPKIVKEGYTEKL